MEGRGQSGAVGLKKAGGGPRRPGVGPGKLSSLRWCPVQPDQEPSTPDAGEQAGVGSEDMGAGEQHVPQGGPGCRLRSRPAFQSCCRRGCAACDFRGEAQRLQSWGVETGKREGGRFSSLKCLALPFCFSVCAHERASTKLLFPLSPLASLL